MNTARDRDTSKLALELSQKSTTELKQLAQDKKQPVAVRRAATHVLLVRTITGGK